METSVTLGTFFFQIWVKKKDKVYPSTGCENPDG
jgi:hypothetical protein